VSRGSIRVSVELGEGETVPHYTVLSGAVIGNPVGWIDWGGLEGVKGLV